MENYIYVWKERVRVVQKSYNHHWTIQNKPKEHLLMGQKEMVTKLWTTTKHKRNKNTKFDFSEDIKIGIKTEFWVKVVEHKQWLWCLILR